MILTSRLDLTVFIAVFCLCIGITASIKMIGCYAFWPRAITCPLSTVDIQKELKAISDELSDEKKHFDMFVLDAPIEELPENVFYDLTFDEIVVNNATNLARIHYNSFNSTVNVSKSYRNYVYYASKLRNNPPKFDLYAALSSFVNLEVISLSLEYNSVHDIPDHAFRDINGKQNNLEYIEFNGYFILSRIGNYAFYDIPNLSFIRFNSITIKNISAHAFDFYDSNERILSIFMQNSSLNEKSFAAATFSNSKRPLQVSLENNNFRYIEKRVFEDFFESNERNIIHFDDNPLNCDDIKQFEWLLKQKSNLEDRLLGAVCANGTNLWNLNFVENEFDINCVLKEIKAIVKSTESQHSIKTAEELRFIMDSIIELQNLVDLHESQINFDNALNLTTNFLQALSNLINQKIAWSNATNDEKSEIASQILLQIQYTSFTLSCKQNTSHKLIEVKNSNLFVNTYHTNLREELIFRANGSSIFIPKGIILDELNTCNNCAFGALINTLDTYLLRGISKNKKINTKILAFSITNASEINQINDGIKVKISLEHNKELQFWDEMTCVFWNFGSMEWSSDGCYLVSNESNRQSSVCECNHLGNFAAIIDLSGREINDISDVNKKLEAIVEYTKNENSITNSKEMIEVMDLIKILQNFVYSYNHQIDFDIALNLTTNFLQLFSNLINKNNAWSNATNDEKSEIASQILLQIQYTSFTLSCNQNISHKLIEVKNKNLFVNTYHTNLEEELIFRANSSSIFIPKGIILDELNTCNNSAFGALINTLDTYLSPEINNEQKINTRILAFSITNTSEINKINDGIKVRISLEHKNKLQFGDKMNCVFWDFESMKWSSNGCELISNDSNRDLSVCECNHLTNFAAIMDISGRETNDTTKSILTIICCGLSIICLALTVWLLLAFKRKKTNSITDKLMNTRNIITLNLCLCLMIANILIIFGMDRTANKWLCQILSALLLYSLLASFSWMLLEGFHLYRVTVHVFSSNSHQILLLMFGYGMPVIICFIGFLIIWFRENILFDALIGDYFCWISSEKHPNHIWILAGPASVAIIINTLLMYTLMNKVIKSNSKKAKIIKSGLIGKQIFGITSLLFNLGISWALFVLYIQQFGPYFFVFSYIFIVLNGLQGVFVFVYHLVIHMSQNARTFKISIKTTQT